MAHLLMALLAVSGPRAPKIAVIDMVDLSGEQATLARQLTQIVVTQVASHSGLKVISSSEISQVLGYEKQKELLGCKDDSCLTELAGALGVDYLMMEQLGKIGSRYRIDIRIADAQHASLIASAGDFISNSVDDVADATVRLTEKVLALANLEKPLAPNLAPARTTTSPMPSAAVSPAPAVGQAAPSHTSAYATWGAAAVLAIAATVATTITVVTYNKVANPTDANYVNDAKPLAVSAPLADGLWAAALVAGGAGAYLYFTASPAPSGAGGELGVGGRF